MKWFYEKQLHIWFESLNQAVKQALALSDHQ